MAQQKKQNRPKQPQDPYAQQGKQLGSAVQRLRGWVGSDPTRTPELADALVRLTEHRLLGHGYTVAAPEAQESVKLAAQLLTANGPIGPYTSVDDAARYVTAVVHLAVIQCAAGLPEAGAETVRSLTELREQLGPLALIEALEPATVIWALTTTARGALATGDLAGANAYADAVLQRLSDSGLRIRPETALRQAQDAAYVVVDADRLVSDARWAAGEADAALTHLHLARETYDRMVDGRLSRPGQLAPALMQRLAEPLYGLYRDLADRLFAVDDVDLGLVTRRQLIDLLRGLAPRDEVARIQLAASLDALVRDLRAAERTEEADLATEELEAVPATDRTAADELPAGLARGEGGVRWEPLDAFAAWAGGQAAGGEEAAALEAELQRETSARLDAEREEARRIGRDRRNAARLAAERRDAERLEAERVAAEQAEVDREEAERAAAEQAEAAQRETARIAAEEEAERQERKRRREERIEAHRLEQERLDAERAEAATLAMEQREAERRAADPAELERLELERLQAELAELERAEAAAAAERATEAHAVEADVAEAAGVETERQAAEAAQLEAERLAEQRRAEERAADERAKAEAWEAQRRDEERLEAERAAAAQVEAERIEAERIEQERLAQEQRAADDEAERVEAERVEAERAQPVEPSPEEPPAATIGPAVPDRIVSAPVESQIEAPAPLGDQPTEPAPQQPEPVAEDELTVAYQAWQEAKGGGDRKAARAHNERVVELLRPLAEQDLAEYGPRMLYALEELSSARLRAGELFASRGPAREAKALAKALGRR